MIIIFGKSGQVGSELSKFPGVLAVERNQVDFIHPNDCAKIIYREKPNAVINAAAYTNVDQSETNEALANIINAKAPAKMARACADLRIPLVHISTDYVFDGSGPEPRYPTDTTGPQNAYGRSKLLGENLIRDSNVIHAILRTSWVISEKGNNFVKTMLRLSASHTRLSIVNDQVGGPTPAKDVASACISIANQLIHNPRKSGTYHFSGKPDVSRYEFAKVIFELRNRNLTTIPILTSDYPMTATRPLNSKLNCKDTETTFGITRPDWIMGLKDILTEIKRTK